MYFKFILKEYFIEVSYKRGPKLFWEVWKQMKSGGWL